MLSTLALCALLTQAPLLSEPVPANLPVQLGVSLRLTHPDALEALKQSLHDPRSPDFRRWLTPAEFGARFGQSAETYAEVVRFFERGGFTVKPAPSRAFLEVSGTVAQAEHLLNIVFAPVEGEALSVHSYVGRVQLPEALAAIVLNISGLDTRVRLRHHLTDFTGQNMLGPQDLRAFYGLNPLLAQGYVGQGQKLVVLSTALPSTGDINLDHIDYFLRKVSDSTTPFVRRVLPNPANDVFRTPGGASEFELDVHMQSVGAIAADSITLVVSPASTVFTIGANDIVNNLADTTAVSISLGICEPNQQQLDAQTGMSELTAVRQAVTQGVVEGQTWSSASGDNGANDCGAGNTVVAIDFPSSIPEMVAAGGTMLTGPQWSASGALTAYQQESTWNGGPQGGAAGGGFSIVYPRPSYQAGLGLPGTMRVSPDLALMSGMPGVATMTQTTGQVDPAAGTSVASPLSAGFFALIASRVGCRLGDVHATLYALGLAQLDGGAPVFHDITTGNLTYNGVTGPSAAMGYDPATGWGSLDVAALAAAWPACPATTTDGGSDGGLMPAPDGGTPYTQCGYLACDGGTTCVTIPDGPSACVAACQQNSNCAAGTVCSTTTMFTNGANGECVPGCVGPADCAATPNTVCALCTQKCIPQGNATASLGDGCTTDSACPSGGYCSTVRQLTGGYCSQACTQGVSGACGCPMGSVCGAIGRLAPVPMCLKGCAMVGAACSRTNYLCQPQDHTTPACLPKCTITTRNGQTIDSCVAMGSTKACNVASGVCGGLPAVVDAGVDAGSVDAGVLDAGQADSGVDDAGLVGDAGTVPAVNGQLGAPLRSCGCSSVDVAPLGLGLLWLLRRRR